MPGTHGIQSAGSNFKGGGLARQTTQHQLKCHLYFSQCKMAIVQAESARMYGLGTCCSVQGEGVSTSRISSGRIRQS